jgi:hypothetical protein
MGPSPDKVRGVPSAVAGDWLADAQAADWLESMALAPPDPAGSTSSRKHSPALSS